MAENIACGGFIFYNNFDSANLAKVEQVKASTNTNATAAGERATCVGFCENDSKSSSLEDAPEYEFNLWTKYDCHGTQYQNNNRTWFYFGIKSCVANSCVRLNIVNLNKQVRMFSQGMCPVYRVIPGQLRWERIRDRPTYTLDQKGSDFTLSFMYTTPENPKAVTYFAFTYPFSYNDLQNFLRKIDARMAKQSASNVDDIYYHRECAIKSLEGRRLDLLTISSYHNISIEREDRLDNMFPENEEQRPFKFYDKKVVFLSARVHPGETPSSFVLNGFLKFLLNREDQIAIHLRRLYVFKLMPMLNPDGVADGHYRMDTRGVNLNRMYLDPSVEKHPTIYAARSLIRYYHHFYRVVEEEKGIHDMHLEICMKDNNTTTRLLQQVTLMTLNEKSKAILEETQEKMGGTRCGKIDLLHANRINTANAAMDEQSPLSMLSSSEEYEEKMKDDNEKRTESGLFLYVDLHGHASKKGVFMYGNHFTDPDDITTCMLLPKLMSINNPNFHFSSCNFTERNMYLIDKRDGMSREGSGRVAVYKMTGLVRSYTLECNYNSGRLVNIVPPRLREGLAPTTTNSLFVPPKYTPAVFAAVGAALGPSILDLTNSNPNSRLPNSQYRSLRGVKSYLKLTQINGLSPSFHKSTHKEYVAVYAPIAALATKGLEVQAGSESASESKDIERVESTCTKKSPTVARNSSSLCIPARRMKTTRKIRQIVNRRCMKDEYVSNIENGSVVCRVSSEIKEKTCSRRGLVASKKSLKESTTKLSNELYEKEEATAVVKHGVKRLKIVPLKNSNIGLPNLKEQNPTNISDSLSKIASVNTKKRSIKLATETREKRISVRRVNRP